MKLLQTAVDENFMITIRNWAEDIQKRDYAALFHIYVPYDRKEVLEELSDVRKILKQEAPGVPVIGCSATGEILDGHMRCDQLVVTVTIFEDPDSRVEVMAYCDENRDLQDAADLLEKLEKTEYLKGIEILTNARYERLETVGAILDALPEDIEIFGGVAVGDDVNKSFVFAEDSEYISDGTAFVFYIGKELHIQTNRMFGWKPIGYPLQVTKSEGPVVYELDGKPAYDVYNHYLHIKKDDKFFYNALEFPWEVQVDEETKYIRHAKAVNADGSILMSSNIPRGSEVRIAYGDPRRIIEHTKKTEQEVKVFSPQVVNIFNCMGRMLFWGDQADVEVTEISKFVKTTGFSALGEILRYKRNTLLNNLSIVTVAMREGKPVPRTDVTIDTITDDGNMPITARLAIFINTITEELMEKNEQLNEMLHNASHDALTELLNRGAIERIIYDTDEKMAEKGKKWHLIMIDVDDFKMVNDNFGHQEGDRTLKSMAKYLSYQIMPLRNVQVGRWGGEEFMILLPEYSDAEAKMIAENIRRDMVNAGGNMAGRITISVGVTSHRKNESVMETIKRVDSLLYRAKSNGKDQVCSDL